MMTRFEKVEYGLQAATQMTRREGRRPLSSRLVQSLDLARQWEYRQMVRTACALDRMDAEVERNLGLR